MERINRTRPHQTNIRLNDEERDYFDALANELNLPDRASLLKKLASGKSVFIPILTRALFLLNNQTNNINQIARRANSNTSVDELILKELYLCHQDSSEIANLIMEVLNDNK
ncbi:plasmid mobilization relaxosome protein MobC [Paraburkholderia silvatlantica]|uniref:Bacterial mobilisation domain-containing protein n=1 Tax=Paraburkholderia silvatlantica TaxID=321895 RepID=A0ABR6FYG3_9BURK|nr:hypothetical protein [Paraburkholderia silvatlantica]MBB2932467.1 hypothetical protein [Paraburkholderia silvatlantica]